jgi:hypothetical protein
MIAAIHAALVAICNIKKRWCLYTESSKPAGKLFPVVTGVALVDSKGKAVRIFYGKIIAKE